MVYLHCPSHLTAPSSLAACWAGWAARSSRAVAAAFAASSAAVPSAGSAVRRSQRRSAVASSANGPQSRCCRPTWQQGLQTAAATSGGRRGTPRGAPRCGRRPPSLRRQVQRPKAHGLARSGEQSARFGRDCCLEAIGPPEVHKQAARIAMQLPTAWKGPAAAAPSAPPAAA